MPEQEPKDEKPDSPPPPKPKVDPFSDAAQAALTEFEPAVSDDDELPEKKSDGEAESAADAYPGKLTDDERTWALLSHLLAGLGFIGVPFGNLIGPGIAYFVKKDESKYVRFHAVQSFTFQLVLTVVGMVLAIPVLLLLLFTAGIALPCVILLGVPISLAILIYVIYAGAQAQKGELVLYPGVGRWAYKKVWEDDWKPV
jgi:uncharacterized Tic20 family protein